MNIRTSLLVSATLLSATGCFTVKTESEIKPIHITMDVNLKVDKELDKAFSNENMTKPQGDFKEIKALLDRKVAGINSKALLEARAGATDDDRILIAESNARKLKRGKDKSATLSTTVRGTATRGRTTVPVDITVNFNGELEQLVNTGLGYTHLLKGKQK